MTVTLVSRPAFAKQHGVSKAAVQKWEARGAVVVVDGKVSVEATDRLLMHAGLGRFSDRPRRASATANVASASHSPTDSRISPEVLLPLATNLLTSYFNRICAFAGLAAWEHGASVETAKQTDETFRLLAMGAATDILKEIDVSAPAGFNWDDAEIWDLERMARIDWSAVEPRNG
jgi:hypothetical protein